jgi:hypothetical protein
MALPHAGTTSKRYFAMMRASSIQAEIERKDKMELNLLNLLGKYKVKQKRSRLRHKW